MDEGGQQRATERSRTLSLTALPGNVLQELVNTLGPRGATIVRAPDSLLRRERIALVMASLALLILPGFFLVNFGEACDPRQSLVWAFADAACLAPTAYLVVRAIQGAMKRASMPIMPGVYITLADVILARSNEARFIPISLLAGVGTPKKAPLARGVELTLWLEGESEETVVVPADEAEAIVTSLERARTEEAVLRESKEMPRRLRRGGDPLFELKRLELWEKAKSEPPRRDWPLAIALGVAVSIGFGFVALSVRNEASDAFAVSHAAALDDVEALQCYADHQGAQSAHVRAVLLPEAALHRARMRGDLAALGEYVEAYPDGPSTAAVREEWIASEFAAARDDAWRLRGFLARFSDAPQAAEGRRILPRLALAVAVQQNEVGSYAYVMREHPGTPEAAEAQTRRAARYHEVLETILARHGRQEASAFFRALFAYYEANDHAPDVSIRFRTPSSEVLRIFDGLTQQDSELDVQPIAPSFSRRISMQRESLVFDRLRTAFARVAPSDVLPVALGRNLPYVMTADERELQLSEVPEEEREATLARWAIEEDDDSGMPEIRVTYEIEPDGHVYQSREPIDELTAERRALRDLQAALEGRESGPDTRAFAGFRILFDIELRMPGEATRPHFTFEIAPPPSIMVDGGEERARDATVYEVMITGAFDYLGVELERAFFGAEEASP